MKFFLITLYFLSIATIRVQAQKNYLLEIDGDTVSIALDNPAILKTKNGQSLKVKVTQKEVLGYDDEFFSFQYPATFTTSSKKVEDGVEQVLCISGGGNGFLIQKYKTINPENLVDVMLEEITEESIDAGYKEKKTAVQQLLQSGKSITGKQAELVLDDEKNIYSVYSVKIKKGGLLIVLLVADPSEASDMKVYDLLWKTLEIKN